MFALFAYLFYFIAASISPLQRRWLAVKRDTDVKGQINLAFKVMFIAVLSGFLLPLFEPFKLSGNPTYLFFVAFICGVTGAGFFVSSYIAQRHVDAGVTVLVSNIYTPITIILATIFLNEKLTSIQIIGTILLLIAMAMVAGKHKIGRFKFDKYFLMMICSGIFLGISLTAERALQVATGISAGTMISWISQCAALGLLVFATRSKSGYSNKDVATTGILRALQALSWAILIFAVGNLSVVSAVTTFKVVIVFVAAAVFLNEREDLPRKIIGTFIAVIGLLLMK